MPALDAAALDALIEQLAGRLAGDAARVLLSVEVLVGPSGPGATAELPGPVALAERRMRVIRQRLLDAGVDAIKVTSRVL